MAFLFTFYCRLSGRCITLLFSFLSCGCPKHSLTWSANKNDPTFSLIFYPAAAAPGFCHNIIKFRFPPKFLNKGCDWYQWGVTAFAFKADVVFVMVTSLVMFPSCSSKSRNNSSDFYLFNVTKSDTSVIVYRGDCDERMFVQRIGRTWSLSFVSYAFHSLLFRQSNLE